MKYFYIALYLLANTSLYAGFPFTPTSKEQIIKELESSDAEGFQDTFDLAAKEVRGDVDAFVEALKRKNNELFLERQKAVNSFKANYEQEKTKTHDWKGLAIPSLEFGASGILGLISYKLYNNFNKLLFNKNVFNNILRPLTSSKPLNFLALSVCIISAVTLFNKAIKSAKPAWYYQDTLKEQEKSLINKQDAHPIIDSLLNNKEIIGAWKDGIYIGFKAYTAAGVKRDLI